MTPDTLQILRPRNTLLFFATLSMVMGVFLHHPGFLMLAVGGIVAVVMAYLGAYRSLENLEVRRHHHPRAFQNSPVTVSLSIGEGKGTRGELVLVEDEFPPGNTSRIRRLVEYPLGEGRGVEIAFQGNCDHRRGMYILGPVRMETHDSLGFFRREVVVECFTKLLVYPEAVDLTGMNLLGEGTLPNAGLEMTRRPGAGEEFMGLRPYRPGDPIRRVHWKSSAHHGSLLVKEFREEVTTLVSLFLDVGRMGLVGVGDQTSVEYGTKCCASVARRASALGHRMQLFTVGKSVDHLPPGAGTGHLLSILDRLAYIRPEGDSGFLAVVGDLAATLPRGSTAVLILGATTIDGDTAHGVLARLMARGVLPIFILIDDRAFIKIFREQEIRHAEAMSLEETARTLRLAGARVHVVGKARSMKQALLQGLEREAVEA